MGLTEINKLGNIQLRGVNVNTIIEKKRKKRQRFNKFVLYYYFSHVSIKKINLLEEKKALSPKNLIPAIRNLSFQFLLRYCHCFLFFS